jgi:hypothetical protein
LDDSARIAIHSRLIDGDLLPKYRKYKGIAQSIHSAFRPPAPFASSRQEKKKLSLRRNFAPMTIWRCAISRSSNVISMPESPYRIFPKLAPAASDAKMLPVFRPYSFRRPAGRSGAESCEELSRLVGAWPEGSLARMKVLAILVGGILTAALGGCASTSPDAHAALESAIAFHRAIDSGDDHAACQLLAPQTLAQLEEQADAACPNALAALRLDAGGDAVQATAYGLAAEVVLAGDTVFLTHAPGGWLVTAAGCSPVPDRPYDCQVKGG